MPSNLTLELIILFILILLSSFFSASETALVSLSKIRLRQMVDEGVKNANIVSTLVDKPNRLLGAILIGNNIVNIAASSLATSMAIDIWGSKGIGVATVVMTLVVLIFGEVTPKSLAAQNSEKTAIRVSKPIYFITIILSPLIYVITSITNIFIKLMGGSISKTQPLITEDELKTIVNVSHEEGVLEVGETKMIYNVFEFGDSQAKDVMTPRTNMVALSVDSSYKDLVELFKEETFSRLPIYEEDIDDIIGVLHVKDLIFSIEDRENFNIRDYLRPAFFTYEFKSTQELFQEMRDNNYPTAIILDEYGGTAGMITTEDLVEEIVGEITDEYDEGNEEIVVIKEDEYIVDGSMKIDLLNDLIGTTIESEDFDSIGGFVIGLLGRFPEEEEMVEYDNIKFIIEKIEKNRIEKMRILT
ncbi:HlyC/CorC family transporter [Tissierella creatinophila]|uniref:Magnesium and cobalt efflux protein CorC n=1 Tax=Tissierella creatinophila DSM 6911 TaxID=1123403 RepID=A0A1U7M3I4_TISCR|nr:hemolysin family protein [Tissierella creatinophila]OLS01846.1 magnesium and cobalt efflux protein CorC [Tissierella creatinophila DSM 6911]